MASRVFASGRITAPKRSRVRSELVGGKELAAVLKDIPELQQLPDPLATNALRSIARAAGVVLQKRAYAQLSVSMSRTARREDVLLKSRRQRVKRRAEVHVGPPRSKPWLRWLHDGTQPHFVAANVGTLTLADFQGEFFGPVIAHPGQEPERWLRKAYRAAKPRMVKKMAEQTSKSVAKQAKKLVSQQYGRRLKGRLSRRAVRSLSRQLKRSRF